MQFLNVKETVLFDGQEVEVTLRFRHWMPRMTKVGGKAIGRVMYFPREPQYTALIVAAHELVHVYDFWKRGKKTIGGYTIDVIVDLLAYFWDWVTNGFVYHEIDEEELAYDEEEKVLNGQHPNIQAPWISERFAQGYVALPSIPYLRAIGVDK